MDNEDIICTLSGLLATCRDAAPAFRRCSAPSSEPRLRDFFDRAARQWAAAGADLERMVAQSGGAAHERERSAARPPEAASGVQNRDSPMAAIDACQRFESAALEQYRQALDEPLPALLRLQIERQYHTVEDNHHELRSLREHTLRRCQA